jgi:hypothetical protein
MHHNTYGLLIASGVFLMAFPFMMVVAEVLFVNSASKRGIPPHKYPRLVVSSFRFFNGHVKSAGTMMASLGLLLTIVGASQLRKH